MHARNTLSNFTLRRFKVEIRPEEVPGTNRGALHAIASKNLRIRGGTYGAAVIVQDQIWVNLVSIMP